MSAMRRFRRSQANACLRARSRSLGGSFARATGPDRDDRPRPRRDDRPLLPAPRRATPSTGSVYFDTNRNVGAGETFFNGTFTGQTTSGSAAR